MTDNISVIEKELKADLWREGDLSWKVLPHQEDFYGSGKRFLSGETVRHGLTYVANCCRRFGKTFLMCLFGAEFALNHPDAHIRFAAPSAKQLKEIIHPIFRKIFEDCPDDLRPEWRTADAMFVFKNGAHIHLAGCDNENLENLRGHESHLNIITEAASIEKLEYLINSILLPQTLTTGGKTLIDSTPSPKPGHYFQKLCMEALIEGNYSEYTIDQNTFISEEVKEIFIRKAGGRDSATCQREYYCKHVVDEQSLLVPEWKSEYIRNTPIPDMYQFYEKYVGMDLGVRDKTVVLFGYWDFLRAKLVIQREVVMNGRDMTTKLIADSIAETEKALGWTGSRINRWSDNNNLLLNNDLQNMHNLTVNPTDKGKLETVMVNAIRLFVDSKSLEVDPSVKFLILSLENSMWNKNRDGFERNDVVGHADAVAALMYLIRNIDRQYNPIPADLGLNHMTHLILPKEHVQNNTRILEEAIYG